MSSLCGGGSSGGSSSFTPYSPTGLASADTGWQTMFQDMMGNLTGSYTGTGATVPMLNQSMQDMLSTIYGPNNTPSAYLNDMMTQANNASAYTGSMATQADLYHNIMGSTALGDAGAAANLQNAGNTIWQQASDPNQNIYNQLLQQTQQQSRGSTAARGIGMSGEAAGIENQAVQNMNLGWQQQQLQNMQTGIQGMAQAYTGAGQYNQAEMQGLTGSQAMSALVPQLMQQSASIPYTQAMSNAQAPINVANTLSQSEISDVLQPVLAMMGSAIPYMNYGSGMQQNAFNAGQANLGTLGTMLTSLGLGGAGGGSGALGSLASIFGSSPFSGLGATAAGSSGLGATAAGGAGFADVAGGGASSLSDAVLTALAL